MTEHTERLVHSIVVDTFELTQVDLSTLGPREREDLEFAAKQINRILQAPQQQSAA